MKKWFNMVKAENKATINIYDVIGAWGVSSKDFRQDLEAMGDVSDIELRINSDGGEVVDGFSIYNALMDHPANVTVYIDGWAASMASVIAMAGDKVIMPENTWLMIHNPWTMAAGDSDDLTKMADILDKMQAHILQAYVRKTGKDEAEIKAMMDAETWMDGKEAVELGFADELVESMEIAASVMAKNFAKAPDKALAWVKGDADDKPEEEKVMDKEEIKEEEVIDPAASEEVVEEEAEAKEEEVVEESEESKEEEKEDESEEEKEEELEPEESPVDVAYDEGELAGFARGQKDGSSEFVAKVSELTAENESLGIELAEAKASLEVAEKALEESKASAKKLGEGFKVEAKEAAPADWKAAQAKYGYVEAKAKCPELYAEFMKQNK